MITYQFYCKDCDLLVEVLRSIKDSNLPHYCPTCDGLMTKYLSGGLNTVIHGYRYSNGYQSKGPAKHVDIDKIRNDSIKMNKLADQVKLTD